MNCNDLFLGKIMIKRTINWLKVCFMVNTFGWIKFWPHKGYWALNITKKCMMNIFLSSLIRVKNFIIKNLQRIKIYKHKSYYIINIESSLSIYFYY